MTNPRRIRYCAGGVQPLNRADLYQEVGDLPDSTMRAISVGYVRRVVCASPSYLKANGTPQVPADLADCTIISSSPVSASFDWRFYSGKKTISVKVKPRLTLTNNEAAIVAAVAGFGITRLLSYQIAPYLNSGQLKVVLLEFEPPRLPIHVLHLEGRQVSAKVRTFVDLLVERLRSDKALR